MVSGKLYLLGQGSKGESEDYAKRARHVMIKYALKCEAGHSFDSWFQSSAAFDKLQSSNMLSCAVCGSQNVQKAVMSPRRLKAETEAEVELAEEKPLSAPASPAEQYLSDMRKKIEETSDDVGREFAKEARKIHDGEAPARAIYGQASLGEVKSLVEDEIPVAPLPWSNRKVN